MDRLDIDYINMIDHLIQENQRQLAFHKIQAVLKSSKINQFRYELSELSRRAGYPITSLKILRSKIISETEIKMPSEIISYSASLFQIGCLQEAKENFQNLQRYNLSKKEKCDLFFQMGLLEMARWNYYLGIRYFSKSLRLSEKKSYRNALCRLNLAICYNFYQKYLKSVPLFQQLLSESKEKSWKIIQTSALEGLSQSLIYQGQYEKAMQLLEVKSYHSESYLDTEISLEELRIKKWKIVTNMLKEKNGLSIERKREEAHYDSEIINQISQLSTYAFRHKYYEEYRDCEFFHAWYTNDELKMSALYYCTSFLGFRKKIKFHLKKFTPKAEWKYYPSYFNQQESLDLVKVDQNSFEIDCEINFKHLYFKLSTLERRLLLCLIQDIYRPSSMGRIFSNVYFEEQFFNPYSTPNRIRRLVNLLNKKFQKLNLPLVVKSFSGGYQVCSISKCEIMISSEIFTNSKFQQRAYLDLAFSDDSKSWKNLKSLAKNLGWSISKTQRWIQDMIQIGTVRSRGSFKDKQYCRC